MGADTIAAVGINASRQGRVHGWMTQARNASGRVEADGRRYQIPSPQNGGECRATSGGQREDEGGTVQDGAGFVACRSRMHRRWRGVVHCGAAEVRAHCARGVSHHPLRWHRMLMSWSRPSSSQRVTSRPIDEPFPHDDDLPSVPITPSARFRSVPIAPPPDVRQELSGAEINSE